MTNITLIQNIGFVNITSFSTSILSHSNNYNLYKRSPKKTWGNISRLHEKQF